MRRQRDVGEELRQIGALDHAVADDVDLPAASRQAAVHERLLGAAQLGEARDALGHLFQRGVSRFHRYSGLILASFTIADHLSSSALM